VIEIHSGAVELSSSSGRLSRGKAGVKARDVKAKTVPKSSSSVARELARTEPHTTTTTQPQNSLVHYQGARVYSDGVLHYPTTSSQFGVYCDAKSLSLSLSLSSLSSLSSLYVTAFSFTVAKTREEVDENPVRQNKKLNFRKKKKTPGGQCKSVSIRERRRRGSTNQPDHTLNGDTLRGFQHRAMCCLHLHLCLILCLCCLCGPVREADCGVYDRGVVLVAGRSGPVRPRVRYVLRL